MPKSKREMLHLAADKIGGELAERIREALKKKSLFDDLLDRPMSDEEFAAEVRKMETELPRALANKKKIEWEKPGTWGLAN